MNIQNIYVDQNNRLNERERSALSVFKIAAVQAAPVFMNREATVAKACGLIAEAAARGARLAVFPEAFIPAYPDWVWAIPPSRNKEIAELYATLVDQSVTIPSPDTDLLCEAARQANISVVMGVNERNTEASHGTLYNTLLFIDAEGNLMGRHRKLVPTAPERMVWGQGDGSSLSVYETPVGRLGGLICWENYMPLARYALYAQGVQIYAAPTWDRGEPWLATLRHIAREGRVYVVGCCMALRRADIPDQFDFKEKYYAADREWINVGGSAIVDPDGQVVAGPLLQEEGILLAEVNSQDLLGAKWRIDVAGHYARPDLFQLTVRTDPHAMLSIRKERGARAAEDEALEE